MQLFSYSYQYILLGLVFSALSFVYRIQNQLPLKYEFSTRHKILLFIYILIFVGITQRDDQYGITKKACKDNSRLALHNAIGEIKKQRKNLINVMEK